MKIGIDIVSVKRIEKLASQPETLANIFSEKERADAGGCPERLAGRFAAKEALMKALGRKIDWLLIEVMNKESGEPYFAFAGQDEILLSIAHEQDYAVAMVVIGQSFCRLDERFSSVISTSEARRLAYRQAGIPSPYFFKQNVFSSKTSKGSLCQGLGREMTKRKRFSHNMS